MSARIDETGNGKPDFTPRIKSLVLVEAEEERRHRVKRRDAKGPRARRGEEPGQLPPKQHVLFQLVKEWQKRRRSIWSKQTGKNCCRRSSHVIRQRKREAPPTQNQINTGCFF